MKTSGKVFTLLFFTGILFIFGSCKDRVIDTYRFIGNKPIYMSYEEMRGAVKSYESTKLKNTGKIYFYNNMVFVNEYLKGIHIIDNSNPAHPENILFIEIPGSIDMLIKNDYLYSDSYVDLVVLDISDLNNIHEINRILDVFPYQIPNYNENYPLASIDEELGVVIGYSIEEIEESYESSDFVNIMPFALYKEDIALEASFSGTSSSQGTGIAGSMARFSLFDNYIYLLNETEMKVYDISIQSRPSYVSELNTNTIAETLFLYESKLFMGTQTGMKVYDLSNPSSPVFISEFQHIQSCDPVVVEGGYAYITLRAGSNCGSITNQLDVIDINVISSPQLVKSYDMTNPHGLGIQDKTLFICDGESGLKIYDASDPFRIDENMIQHFPDINAFDVIPLGTLIIMIAEGGLYQYTYENDEMSFLSHIMIE